MNVPEISSILAMYFTLLSKSAQNCALLYSAKGLTNSGGLTLGLGVSRLLAIQSNGYSNHIHTYKINEMHLSSGGA